MAHPEIDSPAITAIGAPTSVLIVGDWQNREFASATVNILDFHDWSHATDIAEACDLLQHTQQPPELIFLAQPLPGRYRQNDIDRLQQLLPLTRLVIVAGSWCEGELRTGTPPSGVIRLYWYELESWWQATTRRRDAGQCPQWSLPLDHPQAGRFSSANKLTGYLSNDLSKIGLLLSVLIDAADYAVYETLSDALRENDIDSSWQGRDENITDAALATAGIWDGGQLSDRELVRLAHFCRQIDGCRQIDAPVIALLDFPRVEHIRQAQAAGATAVLAKPYIVEELIAALTTPPTPSAKSLAAIPARVPASNESG